jgi:hypothetical protein
MYFDDHPQNTVINEKYWQEMPVDNIKRSSLERYFLIGLADYIEEV